MWYFLLKSIASSILGSATESWFRSTKLGVWFYDRVDRLYSWAAKRYNIKLAQDSTRPERTLSSLAEEVELLDKRITALEQNLSNTDSNNRHSNK